jgi:hypothetical protein
MPHVTIRDSVICNGRTYRMGERFDTRGLKATTVQQLIAGRKIALLDGAGELVAPPPIPKAVALPSPAEVRKMYAEGRTK